MIDVLVIGAGPAGSLAALLLARAGMAVTLVEQHTFPRDKVCGECLSALGIEVLTRNRACDFPAKPIELTRTSIHARDGSSSTVTLPRPMWGISRHVLDLHLLNIARDAGVRVLQPARCESISPVVIRNSITNRTESIEARYVIRADGKPPPDQSTGDFGIKAHFVNVDGPGDAIELFAVNQSYGGLAPIEGQRHNAAFSVSAARLRGHRGNIEALFDEMTHENRTLEIRLRGAERVGPWLASPLPRFAVQNEWTGNVIPIGNSAAAIEPIGGEGMGLALRSAELAASALVNAKRHGKPVDRRHLRREYYRLWNTRRYACRVLARSLSHEAVARWVTPAVSSFDMLTHTAMCLMGK